MPEIFNHLKVAKFVGCDEDKCKDDVLDNGEHALSKKLKQERLLAALTKRIADQTAGSFSYLLDQRCYLEIKWTC